MTKLFVIIIIIFIIMNTMWTTPRVAEEISSRNKLDSMSFLYFLFLIFLWRFKLEPQLVSKCQNDYFLALHLLKILGILFGIPAFVSIFKFPSDNPQSALCKFFNSTLFRFRYSYPEIKSGNLSLLHFSTRVIYFV